MPSDLLGMMQQLQLDKIEITHDSTRLPRVPRSNTLASIDITYFFNNDPGRPYSVQEFIKNSRTRIFLDKVEMLLRGPL